MMYAVLKTFGQDDASLGFRDDVRGTPNPWTAMQVDISASHDLRAVACHYVHSSGSMVR